MVHALIVTRLHNILIIMYHRIREKNIVKFEDQYKTSLSSLSNVNEFPLQ